MTELDLKALREVCKARKHIASELNLPHDVAVWRFAESQIDRVEGCGCITVACDWLPCSACKHLRADLAKLAAKVLG